MLWIDLFLLWNRMSIYRFICFLLIRKSTVSQTHWNTMLPCIFYIVMLILLLYYPAHSPGVTVSIKKEASSLFTHYWLPILLILFTSLRLKHVFHFKHNLCFPASLLHTTWFQHIPVARIIRKIADWLARLSLSNLQSRLLFPCL